MSCDDGLFYDEQATCVGGSSCVGVLYGDEQVMLYALWYGDDGWSSYVVQVICDDVWLSFF